MSNFVTYERVVFENLGGFFMDTNFDKKIFIENFKNNCNKVQIKKFIKGETVTTYIEKRNQICIVLSGEIDLIRYDFNGNKTIIGHYVENDVLKNITYQPVIKLLKKASTRYDIYKGENSQGFSFVFDEEKVYFLEFRYFASSSSHVLMQVVELEKRS